MKTIKKWIVLLAALMLLLLGGCGSTDLSSETDEADAEETQTAREEKDRDTKEEDDEPKFYREARYYDEDVLAFSEAYDSDGRNVSYTNYDSDGEETVRYEYRKTDACELLDDTDVRELDGVEETEIREQVAVYPDGRESSGGVFIISGYDKNGRLIVERMYQNTPDGLKMFMTDSYGLDSHGNPKHISRTTPDGDEISVFDFDNEYRSGRLVGAERTYTCYGNFSSNRDGEITVDWLDEPVVSKLTVEYVY